MYHFTPKWKYELQDLLEYALVETSLSEAGIEKDILSIYFHLTKLVEAAHLIDVRENYPYRRAFKKQGEGNIVMPKIQCFANQFQ